jgi:hypothetical protein
MHAAGIGPFEGAIEDTSLETYNKIMDVNL